MIKILKVFGNTAVAERLNCPQLFTLPLTSLLLASGIAYAGEIEQRQVATIGLPPADRGKIICRDREASNLCQRLLNEPDYRDLWLETGDKLTKAEWLLAEKLVDLRGQIDTTNETIKFMIDRAPKLPDGRAVFRTRDNRYFDIDGNSVSPEVAATAR